MPPTARELTWYSRYQPETLRAAVTLLYLNAAMSIFFLFASATAGIFILVDIAAGIGIANDKRWAFVLGLVAAVAPIALIVATGVNLAEVLSLLFYLALIALLVHPHSRRFVRTYFR